MTLAEVENLVREIDQDIEDGSDLFKAGVTVMSCLLKGVGVDVDKLCSFTRYEREFVVYVVRNLRENQQTDGNLLAVDWVTDGSFNGLGFLMTVLCATGQVSIEPEKPTAANTPVAYQHPEKPESTWPGCDRRQE